MSNTQVSELEESLEDLIRIGKGTLDLNELKLIQDRLKEKNQEYRLITGKDYRIKDSQDTI